MRVKEESENPGLKLNIKNTKMIAFGCITSWQTDGENMEMVTNFIFLVSKIAADNGCSHEIKRCLLLGRIALTNRQCIKKERHHFASKGYYSQSSGFSCSHVWM